MRIIAGSARGRMIRSPEGLDTRPTLDRIRVTIFDILQFQITGKSVLDLYGGSGAMSLEALSRGAAYAVVCDENRAAQQAIEQNAKTLGFENRITLMKMRDLQALEQLKNRPFDLIFLDPPYAMDMTETVKRMHIDGNITNDTIVVAEFREHTPQIDAWFECYKSRHFADINVRFYRLKGEEA